MERLLREPHRFGFDAALRVLMRKARVTDPARSARFASDPALAFPAGEIAEVRPGADHSVGGVHPGGGDNQAGARGTNRPPRVKVPLIGLVGAAGVLPRLYGTLAMSSARRGSMALQDFLDLLGHRLVAFFGSAGIKYRLHRSTEVAALAKLYRTQTHRRAQIHGSEPNGAGRPGTQSLGVQPIAIQSPAADPIAGVLLALTGHANPGLTERLVIGSDPLLHYAGLFAMRPRSAERLQALVSDWLGLPAEVCQFAGSWLLLPLDQQTSLPLGGMPGTWNRLGGDAVVGVQSWDIQARIMLRIGPLEREGFTALLPDGPVYSRLVSLVRTFVGLETGLAINPVLKRDAGFPLLLTEAAKPLLGWNTWLAEPDHPLDRDAADAVFEAG